MPVSRGGGMAAMAWPSTVTAASAMRRIADLHRRRALLALHAPVHARRVVDKEERQVAALESHDARKIGRRGMRSHRDKSEN